MPYRISQEASQKGHLSQKQTQRLMMSKEMQQALHLLQLPIMELAQMIEQEMEANPVLEINLEEEREEGEEEEEEESHNLEEGKEMDFTDGDFSILTQIDDEFSDLVLDAPTNKASLDDAKRQTFLESSILDVPSLFEMLMKQSVETFDTEHELEMAEIICGTINDHGFLETPIKELALQYHFKTKELEKVLDQIHQFDPPGIGAKNIQEALLIQLRRQNKQGTLAYKIVQLHYDDLLHNRIPVIQRALKVTADDISYEVDHIISKLDNHPGLSCSRTPIPYIIPDVLVDEIDGVLEVVVNNEALPPLRLSRSYMKMLKQEALPAETRKFIEEKLHSAKWLMRIVNQRESTIARIIKFLIQKDRDFFLAPEGKIKPLTMKTVADELELHESTIARAVQNKYVSCPRGTLPIRSFFTSTFIATDGEEVSSKTVKEILKSLIESEDKLHPLSDEDLSKVIQAKGIPCARRTVAKFRAAMGLGNQHQRRKF